MQQLTEVWSRIGAQRRIIAVIAAVAMFAAVLGLTRMAGTPTMSLLYAGLESSVAGEVVAALEQGGVAYEVRGDSIFVDSAQRDGLRMTLASQGLPASTSKGYELLDNLSGFSTTSQMFDAAYLRAKEGELARTIMASAHIRSARVHIANSSSNPFQRDIQASASVTVVPSNGTVSPSQAKALSYLISSAVAGLRPENVAVIDAAGNLIGASDDQSTTPIGEERAAALRERVQRLLEARVGFGNAVVEVSVDTVTEAESIVERRFDPSSRVAISTETEERSTNANDSNGGDVTVASNLPDGDAAGGNGTSSSQNSETRERINYEVSETQREIVRQPGDIKRVTVAVLVNGEESLSPEGEPINTERSEQELGALRDLVASAVGLDESRGDEITIKSMEFQPIAPLGTLVEPTFLQKNNLDLTSLIQMAVLAIVALILGLFVLRPLFAKPSADDGILALENGMDDNAEGAGAMTGEIDFDEDIPEMNFIETPASDLGSFAPAPAPAVPQDPVARLRAMIGERQEETVEILRSWMEDQEEKA
ncbi:flagellar M-ring protein FliF [Poseidonocella pacifica]|uniref:Flagellar M-ring protein n=1 Tax=Poseidonocella pacifica TaxID=871651 RepID=A0A1I0XWJ6_9RHOB|nr:flagellar basal-body MS-ring/collar protein FliF [Poseidonocella pacifica]SFB05284.1 flagellar M-ring protein FliF [Poseidonocella pacifica]